MSVENVSFICQSNKNFQNRIRKNSANCNYLLSTNKNEDNRQNKLLLNEISSSVLKANFSPVSFKGNAPSIKNSYIITSEKDIPLLITKKNDSYVVDFDSQTEIIYGIDAVKYLDFSPYHQYDTQVIFPKNTDGIIRVDGKEIKLPENTAVLINEDSEAEIEVKRGYPMVIISKKDYDWYERYGRNASDINIKNKFLELIYYNSHLYNGEFTPNVLLSEKLRDEDFLKGLSIDKWASRNNLVYDIYAKKDLLNEEDCAEIEFVKTLMDKLYSKGIIESKDDGYVRFRSLYNEDYQRKYLAENGFSDKEIDLLMPVCIKSRQINIDSKFSIKTSREGLEAETIKKMEKAGILFSNKNNTSPYIYWRECYGNEQSLRNKLNKEGFSQEEQSTIVRKWRDYNNTGFDISGLKFLNANLAIYNLNDKLNNWTHEKTNWVTNSTAISSSEGKTPFIGVSMVQSDKKTPVSMDEIRREEKLHMHPNLEEKRQTEIYMVTSGAAALNIVRNGKSQIKILKEGDLAVVGPGVAHCINSIIGEYEHIVTQVPSAFQYGFGFKSIVTPPEDYNEETLKQEAFKALLEAKESNVKM